MFKFSVAMIATFAVACGGAGKPDPAPPPSGGGATDTALTNANTEQPKPEGTSVEPAPDPAPRKVLKVVMPSELKWTPLVPEAGDKGPMTASLWGDMHSEANGFFIKLPAGDKGMLHTHTNDYHAIALAGPAAAGQEGGKVTPTAHGSYIYEPGGVAHTNTCGKGAECMAFVHYNAGKFDFAPAKPTKGAKVDPRAVTKKLKDVKWIPFDATDPKGGSFAPLWGDAQSGPNGMYIKLPAGNAPFWHIHRYDYHGVVIAGTTQHYESGTEGKDLPVGTYWWQPGGNKHVDLCKAGGPDCIVYVYFTNAFDVKAAE